MNVLFLLIAGILLLQQPKVYADTEYSFNSNNLIVVVKLNGGYIIYRGSRTAANKQFFSDNTHIFAIKIGDNKYVSGGTNGDPKNIPVPTRLTAADVSNSTSHITKQYTGTYNGAPFSVTWTIKSNPADANELIMNAKIDAGSIPAGTPIKFAYGFDSYVNGDDVGRAITSPNIWKDGAYLNGSARDVTLTPDEVHSLVMSGCINSNGNGSVMAFKARGGRAFDRAFSSQFHNYSTKVGAYPHVFIDNTSCNFSYRETDSGIAVAYDNISAGTTTTIETGLIFTDILEGELNFYWNGVKDKTISIGNTANMELVCSNYNAKTLADMSFSASLPAGLTLSAPVSRTGFSGGSLIGGTAGWSSVKFEKFGLAANRSGTVSMPVTPDHYGQWTATVIDLTDLVNILPPFGLKDAVLTVTADVNYASTTPQTVTRGNDATITVQLPNGVNAQENLVVNLTYAGSTAAFSALPPTVTIPAGQNSADLIVTASPTATANSSVTVTISGTENPCVIPGASTAVTINMKVPTLIQPANQAVCVGDPVAVSFTGDNVAASQCAWTVTSGNGTAIGLSGNNGTGNISFTAENGTAAPVTAHITVDPGSGGDSKSFTVTVNPHVTVNPVTDREYFRTQSVPAITFSSPTTSNVTYSWTSSNTEIGLAATGGTGNIPSFTAVNTTNMPIASLITVTPTYNGACAGTPLEFTLTVKPNPTITYHYNGGITPFVPNPTNFVYGPSVTVSNEPTRLGHTFGGWTCPELTVTTPTTPFVIPANTDVNLNLYADWGAGPNSYMINYDLGGGSIPLPDPNPVVYDVTTPSFTLKNPEKTGYTFNGWTGTDLNSATMSVSIPQGSTGNRSYTAHWTPITYAITYDLAGGAEGNPANPASYNIETATITLSEPTRSGYAFAGWSGADLAGTSHTNVTIPTGSTGDRSYTAHWTPISYPITYTLNGGTIPPASVNPSEYYVTTPAFTLSEPTRKGYTFKGWSGTDLTGEANLNVVIPQGSTGARSYEANWTRNTYAIKYTLTTPNGEKGEALPPNPTSYNVDMQVIALTNPTHPGYTFTGWSGTNLTGDNNLIVTIPEGSTGNREYTAHWALSVANDFAITYTLTTPNASELITVNPPNPKTYNIETPTFTLTNPAHPGYTFKGWSGTDLTGSGNMNVSVAKGSLGERDYIAHWAMEPSNNFKINYTLNGGTASPENPTTYNVQTPTITLNNPTREGYTFKGWSGTDLTGNDTLSVIIPKGSVGDRSYTAHWIVAPTNGYSLDYTLTTPNNQSGAVSPPNPTQYFVNTPAFTLTNPTHPGYTFTGWTGSNGTNPQTTVTIPTGSTGNRTYTANWSLGTANEFTITYALDPPTMPELTVKPSNPTKYNIETNTFTLAHPTHPGYTFTGWSGTDLTGNNNMTVAIPVGSTGNRSYTAHWSTANDFSIGYTLTTPNGDVGTISGTPNPDTYNVTTATFTLKNPTHPGYTFTGWTGSNGTNPQTTVTIPTGSAGNRTYTANWSLEAANEFTIGYTLNGGAAVNPTTYNVQTPTFTLTNPTRAGYTFKGWSGTDLTGDANISVSIPAGSTGNRVYVANWEVLPTDAFTLAYTLTTPNGESGIVSPPNPTQYFVNTPAFTLTNPTHPGYTFTGWTGSNGTTQQTTVTIPTGSTGNRTYTAHWKLDVANEFTITYALDPPTNPELTVKPSNPEKYNIETNTFTLTNPAHPGYTFTGWSGTDLTGNNNMSVTIPKGSTGSRSYMAHWELQSTNHFTIDYTLATATAPELIVVNPDNPTTYNIRTPSFTLTNPAHPGYTFTGWSGTGLTGNSNMSVTVSAGSTGNRSYTANWKLDASNDFTVNYTLDTPNGEKGVIAGAPNPEKYNVETATFTLKNPAHPGYTFIGWTGSNGTTAHLTVTVPKGSTGNRTYTAQWALEADNEFTIDYVMNGGSAINPTTYNVETPTITLTIPTRDGYEFAGWTGTGLASATKFVSIPTGSTGDRTYTANWKVITYEINYDYAGGTATNPKNYTVATPTFTLTNPTRKGYTFAGWSGGGLAGMHNLTVTVQEGSFGNLSYTAHWEADSYTIAFDAAGGVNPAIPPYWSSYGLDRLPTGISITPQRPGYTFGGWSGHGLTNEKKPFDIHDKMQGVPGNLKFTAQWTANLYTITYDPNGGRLMPGNPGNYDVTGLPLAITVHPVHSDPGHTFVGWSSPELPATPKQMEYIIPEGTFTNLTLKANWSQKLDNLNGGSGDTLFVCEAPRTLFGDPQAQSWTWILPDGRQQTGRDIHADMSGRYISRADYGSIVIADTLHVYFLTSVQTKIDYLTTTGAREGKPQHFAVSFPEEMTDKVTAVWTVSGDGTIVYATGNSLTVIWRTTGEKHVSVRLTLQSGNTGCTKTFTTSIKISESGLGFFVNQSVTGGRGDGSSWADAYRTIGEALSGALPGDRIWVARGTYSPDAGAGSFLIRHDSIEIYGGFAGTEDYLYERNPQRNETTMDGDKRHPVVVAGNGNGLRIDGFTIRNGGSETNGGGIRFTGGASGTIANSIIRKNTATAQGGGIFASAPWYGYTGMQMVNTEISGNLSANGAGVYNEGGDMQLLNVTVSGNKASEKGGGFYNNGGNPRILNTIVWGNVAMQSREAGRDMLNAEGQPYFENSLVGASGGSGKWNNAMGVDGGGNRDTNPIFLHKGVESDNVTLRDGNYHLSGTSAAVNTGNSYFVTKNIATPWDVWLPEPRHSYVEGLPMDLDYNQRLDDIEMVDMGAYEYNSGPLDYNQIYREVILPGIDDVTTVPGAGSHYVRSRDDFEFTVTASGRYAGEPLVVTTSRTTISDKDGVVVVKRGDDFYHVTIRMVQDRIEVYLNFGWDIPGDIAGAAGNRIWAVRGELHVQTARDVGMLRIYTLSGQLVRQQPSVIGETVIPLPQGVYVVSLGETGMRQKVIIR
jgi:uncharacterized repeat protein (TIGR02543 family)